jgi:hypothetical protein
MSSQLNLDVNDMVHIVQKGETWLPKFWIDPLMLTE